MKVENIEQLAYGHFPSNNVYKAKIKNGKDWYWNKIGEEVSIVRFGSMGCLDEQYRYFDFYDLEFLP